ASEGKINDELIDIVRSNVREPAQVAGDLYALGASNDAGISELTSMMNEFAIETLDEVGSYSLTQSEAAMLEAVDRLPRGTYSNRMVIDGVEKPVELAAALTISDKNILLDLAGTSAVSSYGVNVPLCYTHAYATFAIHCVVAPKIPKNAG